MPKNPKPTLPPVKGIVRSKRYNQTDEYLALECHHPVAESDGWKAGDFVEMKVVSVNGHRVIE